MLLDDLDAREWTIRHDLPITGTAGLVLRGKWAGLYLRAPLLRAAVAAAGE